MIAEDVPDRPRRHNPAILPLRFLLYWVVKLLVLLFLGIRFLLRPKVVRYGLMTLLVGSAIAWKLLGSPAVPLGSAAGTQQETISTPVDARLPQPPIVERYLKAQAAYDANGMWDTMADRLKQRMMTSNNSPEQLQKELDLARQQQRSYSSVAYIGGAALNSSKGAYFYVLTVEGPDGATRLPYTFVVDQDGKIGNIQWSMER